MGCPEPSFKTEFFLSNRILWPRLRKKEISFKVLSSTRSLPKKLAQTEKISSTRSLPKSLAGKLSQSDHVHYEELPAVPTANGSKTTSRPSLSKPSSTQSLQTNKAATSSSRSLPKSLAEKLAQHHHRSFEKLPLDSSSSEASKRREIEEDDSTALVSIDSLVRQAMEEIASPMNSPSMYTIDRKSINRCKSSSVRSQRSSSLLSVPPPPPPPPPPGSPPRSGNISKKNLIVLSPPPSKYSSSPFSPIQRQRTAKVAEESSMVESPTSVAVDSLY